MDATLAELTQSLGTNSSEIARDEQLTKLKSKIAALAHGRASFASAGGQSAPDVWVDGTSGGPPLAITVALWPGGSRDRYLTNRIAEVATAAAELKERSPGHVRLALLVVAKPGDPPTDLVDLGTRLMAAGYDRVVVGVANVGESWLTADARGTLTPVPDLGSAVAYLRNEAELTFAPVDDSSVNSDLRPRMLFVADEWHSEKGGISTLNRELAVACAKVGLDIRVMVPEAGLAEVDAARMAGVRLVIPAAIPGITGNDLLLTPPSLGAENYEPDVIVGHGRILGPYAFAQRKLYFPTAKRVHIVHTDADRLEDAKEYPGGPSHMLTTDERRELEVALATSADLVVGIGPLLAKMIDNAMRGPGTQPRPPVYPLIPGLRDWGGVVDLDDLPDRRQVLLVARAEDVRSKGLDIAINMVVRAIERLGDSLDERPALVIRGVRPEDADAAKHHLEDLASPYLEVFLRPYSSNEAILRNDLWGSRVVIMPSRHEGFGLAAYEAIAAGVPVLITAESGLAQVLGRYSIDGERKEPREVLPVRGEDDRIVKIWADALYQTLVDPAASFARAAQLRQQLLARISWERTVTELLDALGYSADTRPDAGPDPGSSR